MKQEYYVVPWSEYHRYNDFGRTELSVIYKAIPDKDDDRSMSLKQYSKSVQNKFKKHLGFTCGSYKKESDDSKLVSYEYRIVIFNKKKLMLFRIKYGI